MKQEDKLCEMDLVDNFWQRIRELMAQLQITQVQPLIECLPEDQRQPFDNLINGVSPRYTRLKEREQQQQTNEVL